jgi:hypothetical protein
LPFFDIPASRGPAEADGTVLALSGSRRSSCTG